MVSIVSQVTYALLHIEASNMFSAKFENPYHKKDLQPTKGQKLKKNKKKSQEVSTSNLLKRPS